MPSASESPVQKEGSETENSHTQLVRDYVSIKEKRRCKDQHISEAIHALKLGL